MEKTIYSKEYKILRKWLVKIRNERGLTQRDVGKMLDISHSWVGKIEQGERRLDIIEYIKLCNVLKVDPQEGVNIITKSMN